jgi:hypothetical protein
VTGYALDIGAPSAWVSVDVHRKLVTVWCQRCRSGSSLYWTVISKKHEAVREVVEVHNLCVEGA